MAAEEERRRKKIKLKKDKERKKVQMAGKTNEDAERMARELSQKKGECVRVIVRVRPIGEKEIDGTESRLSMSTGNRDSRDPRSRQIRRSAKSFTFDNVYGHDAIQKNIYDETAAPIVEAALPGYNGTIFAYGQTGAGKTFTMEGYPDRQSWESFPIRLGTFSRIR